MEYPGVIFFAETAEQYYDLRDMSRKIRQDDIRVDEGYDSERDCPKFEVYAHGNTVVKYLRELQKS